jgi:hypothetical protein
METLLIQLVHDYEEKLKKLKNNEEKAALEGVIADLKHLVYVCNPSATLKFRK